MAAGRRPTPEHGGATKPLKRSMAPRAPSSFEEPEREEREDARPRIPVGVRTQ